MKKNSTKKKLRLNFTNYQEKIKKNSNINKESNLNEHIPQEQISFLEKNISLLQEQYNSLKLSGEYFDKNELKLNEELSNIKSKKNNNYELNKRKYVNEKTQKDLLIETNRKMCRTKLGNKLLISLDVDEINSNQIFDRKNLAYPVLKRKKIQFLNTEYELNNKFLGKKKKLNDFNNSLCISLNLLLIFISLT